MVGGPDVVRVTCVRCGMCGTAAGVGPHVPPRATRRPSEQARDAPGPRRACRAGCEYFQPCPLHNRRWARSTVSSARRGYGAEHRALRRQVLDEEPLCRACRVRPSTICDHRVPLSRGGLTVRENLQGLCRECSASKSGQEGAAARSTFTSGLVARPKPGAQAVSSSRRLRDFLPLPPGAA
jgi:5-methylcytosine-specific restriction protein A